jgi:ribosomal protein S18 acetylase RimI-like enzyme
MQQALPSGMQGSSLGLASQGGGKASGNPVYNQVYTRANTTFERRFFETKFTGFFRLVPSDQEKDLVIAVKTAKQEILGVRISRISATEVHFQTKQGAEVGVPFGEIAEVAVKPKSAK